MNAEFITNLISENREIIKTLMVFGISLFVIFLAYIGEMGEIQ